MRYGESGSGDEEPGRDDERRKKAWCWSALFWVGAGRTWTPTSNKVGADMLLLLLGAVAGFWEVLLGDAHGLMPPTCTGSIGDGKLDDSGADELQSRSRHAAAACRSWATLMD